MFGPSWLYSTPSVRRAVGGAAAAMLATRRALEQVDEQLSTWIDRAMEGLAGERMGRALVGRVFERRTRCGRLG